MTQLTKVLEFFDAYSLEDELNWLSLPAASPHTSVEVRWQRRNGQRPWQLRFANSATWHYFDRNSFLAACEEAGICRDILCQQLSQTAIQQATYADLLCKEALALFGKEKILAAKNATHAFLESLSGMIATTQASAAENLTPKPKRSLRVIEGLGSKA